MEHANIHDTMNRQIKNTFAMTEDVHHKIASEPMSDRTFARFSKFIHTELGIKMPDSKKTMLQARLQKRLWKLNLSSFDEYCDYLFSHDGLENELQHMFDVVTTNKTEFFRESKHFDYLVDRVLPDLIKYRGLNDPYMIWCAGCSTGEEPYSLAMVLHEFAEKHYGFHFLILGTDISSKVLEQAKLGIYDEDRVETVPLSFRQKYLLRSREKDKALVRVSPDLRNVVRFRGLNLMDQNFGLREQMDIIFCRNVIIYFDRPTQEGVLDRICSYLKPGGYLFTGHSETLNGMNLPVVPVAHTVYRHLKTNEQAPKDLPVTYLKPAEMHVTDKPSVVRTILGSCLAVTMFNQRLGFSAICHALLPSPDSQDADNHEPFNKNRYVESVLPEMIRKMREQGIEPNEIEVKVFGGADLMSSPEERKSHRPVGKLNVALALQILETQGFQVSVKDVGGTVGRKIFFYTHSGEVLLKRLKSGIFPSENNF